MNRQLASWHPIPPAFEDPGGAVVASAQRHRGVQCLATLLAATEKARCAAARLDSDVGRDFLRFGNCFPKVPVLIFTFESWYISNKDYPLRCNQSRFKAVGNRQDWFADLWKSVELRHCDPFSHLWIHQEVAPQIGGGIRFWGWGSHEKDHLPKKHGRWRWWRNTFFCCCHVVFLSENHFFSEWQLN